MIYKFKITLSDVQGKTNTIEVTAASEVDARNHFSLNPYLRDGKRIKNVDNITITEFSVKVADSLISMGKNSPDPYIKKLAAFSKPVSVLAASIVNEYKHVLVGDKLDSPKDFATKLFKQLTK